MDILTLLSSHCQLCPAARHLAIYLLDHFMDRYNITASKQLYTVAVSCLLLASKCRPIPPSAPVSLSVGFAHLLCSSFASCECLIIASIFSVWNAKW